MVEGGPSPEPLKRGTDGLHVVELPDLEGNSAAEQSLQASNVPVDARFCSALSLTVLSFATYSIDGIV